jgi:SAM-dependent MidA family methyltransferase
VTQSDFLKTLGIEARAQTLTAKATPQVASDVEGALQRLIGTGAGGMGALFKVLGIADPALGPLVGFGEDPAQERATS